MARKSKPRYREVARSAVDGRFVTKAVAKRRPKTTVVERIRIKPRRK